MNNVDFLKFKDLSFKLRLSKLSITLLKFLAGKNYFNCTEEIFIASFVLYHQENGSLTLFLSDLKPNLEDYLKELEDPDFTASITNATNIFLDNKKLCSNNIDDDTPFIVIENNLSTRSFYLFENDLKEKIKVNLLQKASFFASKPIDNLLEKINHPYPIDDVLKKALFAILNSNFLLLSGGPGYGKTTALSLILKMILQDNAEASIILSAPTGRATSRMKESLNNDSYLSSLNLEGLTLHKLLGINDDFNMVQKNEINPISYDVIAIDESSMIDANQFYHLLNAMPQNSKLILIGDGDQLASINTGSILEDMILKSDNPRHLLHKNVAVLTTCYRSDKAILEASKAILSGDILTFNTIIKTEAKFFTSHILTVNDKFINETLKLFNLKELNSARDFTNADPENLSAHHLQLAQTMLNHFKKFIVLSPINDNSIFSSMAINNALNYLVNAYKSFYHGKPVIITQNNSELDLTNGERGVVIEIAGKTYAFFEPNKLILTDNLMAIETSYAITIHKSQGSEFEKISLVLPNGSQRLLNRNLIYTALTRAKTHVYLSYTSEALEKAFASKSKRSSNLSSLFL